MKQMKNIIILIFTVVLTACGTGVKTWQDHYDLGMRYLSEGNYEEAILSFTAAIEIDAKRIEAFIGRGDAYFAFDELEDHFEFAIADFETALGLDEMNVDAYLKLADVYFAMDDIDKAVDILKKGCSITNDEKFKDKLASEGLFYVVDTLANIIANSHEYKEEEDDFFDTYGDVKVGSDLFGIRFKEQVPIGETSIVEAQVKFEKQSGLNYDMFLMLDPEDSSTFYDYNWDYVGKDAIMTGYISYDENYKRISLDEYGTYNFKPNGPYIFEISRLNVK